MFERYTALVEGSIQRRLEASLPGFDMAGFMAMLDERKVWDYFRAGGVREGMCLDDVHGE